MRRWARLSIPNWARSAPSIFDIVTGYYPESKPKAGTPAHRPCLITKVFQDEETGLYAVEIIYGTKNLKSLTRRDKDIIIQNCADLDEMGLPVATRFMMDPDCRVVLEWLPPNFEPWSGYKSPKLGHLLLDYEKEYAWLMAKRASV